MENLDSSFIQSLNENSSGLKKSREREKINLENANRQVKWIKLGLTIASHFSGVLQGPGHGAIVLTRATGVGTVSLRAPQLVWH